MSTPTGPQDDRELDELLIRRSAENPRRASGRQPAGVAATRRALVITAAAVAVATAVLVLVAVLE